jgi:serine/threonine protein phosphatase PrpC
MPLSLNIGKCTLLGNYRENNEDAIEVKLFPDLTVCIVADGMGGQAAGEIASKKAIDIIPVNCGRSPQPSTPTTPESLSQVDCPGQRRDYGHGRSTRT